MPATYSNHLLAGGVAGQWIRLVNNASSVAYISGAATTALGLFQISNIPPGTYTVYTGPTAAGGWTPTGEVSYIVPITPTDSSGDDTDLALRSLSLQPAGPYPNTTTAAPGSLNNIFYAACIADGITGNQSIINSAIIAAAAVAGSSGSIVQLPPGKIFMDGPIFPLSNVWIRGAGMNATTLLAGDFSHSTGGDVVRIKVNSQPYANTITITDLTIDCSANNPNAALGGLAATFSNGMTLQGVDNLSVERVRIVKPFGFGIFTGSNNGVAPYQINSKFRDIYIEGERNGNDSLGGGGISYGSVDHLWVYPAADGTNPQGEAIDWTNNSDCTWSNIYALTNQTQAGLVSSDFGAVRLAIRDLTLSGGLQSVRIGSNVSGQASQISIDTVRVITTNRHAVFFDTTAGFGCQTFSIKNIDVLDWNVANNGAAAIRLAGGHDGEVAGTRFGTNTRTGYAILLIGDAGSSTLNPPTWINVHDNDVSQPTNTIRLQFIGTPPVGISIHDNPGYDIPVTQSPVFAASFTPKLLLGRTIELGALTANLTVTQVSSVNGDVLYPGSRFTLTLTQDGTGGRTVTWNAAYNTAWQPASAAGAISSITFEYDGALWQPVAGQLAVDQSGNALVAGALGFSTAVGQIIPGATSLALRNNANNANNLILTDAGAATIRAGLTVSAGGAAISGNAGSVVGITGGTGTVSEDAKITLQGRTIIGFDGSSGLTLFGGSKAIRFAPTTQGSAVVAFDFVAPATGTVTAETTAVRQSSQTLTITGGYATQRFALFSQPTITAGSALTVTNAATVAIANAPAAAGSAILTSTYALWVQAGISRFDGLVDLNNGVALGGGAAPTVGTIGGSGPATAGQNSWLKVNIGGTASFLPVWR